eukprot:scaffold1223_cov119-Cylindrotheca_fusiformis.AAC.21
MPVDPPWINPKEQNARTNPARSFATYPIPSADRVWFAGIETSFVTIPHRMAHRMDSPVCKSEMSAVLGVGFASLLLFGPTTTTNICVLFWSIFDHLDYNLAKL